MLFFGQRMARDYTGAAALIPYFILPGSGLCLMVHHQPTAALPTMFARHRGSGEPPRPFIEGF